MATDQDQDKNRAFLENLTQRVSPAYGIFPGLENAASAAKLVDVIVAEKLTVPANFAAQAALGDDALRAWGNAAEGAKPYRHSMQLVIDSFPGWWQLAGAAKQAALAAHFPQLAPAVNDLGDQGVRDLIEAGPAALHCAAAYSLADTKAVRAIGSIARAGKGNPDRCSAVLDALRERFPLSMIEESREAERFLPALGNAVEASGSGWAEAVELAALLVANDPSSAYGVLEALPKSIARAGEKGDKKAYLAAFVALVQALGNRVSGVCLKQLAGTSQPEIIQRAVELATSYGVVAGERYLEESL